MLGQEAVLQQSPSFLLASAVLWSFIVSIYVPPKSAVHINNEMHTCNSEKLFLLDACCL